MAQILRIISKMELSDPAEVDKMNTCENKSEYNTSILDLATLVCKVKLGNSLNP